jgi:hypothetical protein
MRVAAAALLVCLLQGGTAHARDHTAEGRYHLKKANALAGDGKCQAAVKEFTSAYEKLHDPVVLFNRAECYRRLGDNAKAVEDYRAFLEGFPRAPNRADIEARIAALERPAARPEPAAPRASPSGARTPPATPTQPPPGGRTPPPIATAPKRPNTPPAGPPAARPPGPAEIGPMPLLPPPPPAGATPDAPVLVEAPRATPKETPQGEEAHGSRWWLWTTLAVVAVGGGVAGYLLLRPKDQAPPETALGHYRF